MPSFVESFAVAVGSSRKLTSAFLRLAFLFALIINSSHCIKLPCAAGDPSCDAKGIIALIGVGRPSVFLAGSNQGQVAYSSDSGRTWSVITVGPSTQVINGFAALGDLIFAFGDTSGGDGFFYTSSDLENWTGPVLISGSIINHGDGDGSHVYLVASADASLFQVQSDGGYNNIGNINSANGAITMLKHLNGQWFAGDSSGGIEPFLSYGTNPASLLTPSNAPTNQAIDIAFINGEYMAMTSGATAAFITNAGSLDNWSAYNPGSTFTSICGDGTYGMAGTSIGEVRISVDGQTVGAPFSTGLASVHDIACGPFSIVVIPSSTASWAHSEDGGLTWIPVANPFPSGQPNVIEYYPAP